MEFSDWLAGVPQRVYGWCADSKRGGAYIMCIVAMLGGLSILYGLISPSASFVERVASVSLGSLAMLYCFFIAEESQG